MTVIMQGLSNVFNGGKVKGAMSRISGMNSGSPLLTNTINTAVKDMVDSKKSREMRFARW